MSSKGRYWAGIAITLWAILAVTPSEQSAAHSAVPEAQPQPTQTPTPQQALNNALKQLCAWPSFSDGRTREGNTGQIDTDAFYRIMQFARIKGVTMRITGQYPYARYFSITAYAGRAQTVIDSRVDRLIVPDRGSVNPYLPAANRKAKNRNYTITIRQGLAPASGVPPNTLYTGPYHPVTVMYRIYAPDQGVNDEGGVPTPRVQLTFDNLPGGLNSPSRTLDLPQCQAKAVRSGNVGSTVVQLAFPQVWKRVGAGGIGTNADAVYLDTRLNHNDAQVYMIRFKAPTFAHTFKGYAITGKEQVRFWSMCLYNMQTSRVISCLHDYQAVQSHAGYVTLAISTLPNKPTTATQANGVNWIPFGPEDVGLLVYRQLLPDPQFAGNLANVASDATGQEVATSLGRYYPLITSCATQAFLPTACSNVLDPTECTDLLEPMPCPPHTVPGATAQRRLTLSQQRIATYQTP